MSQRVYGKSVGGHGSECMSGYVLEWVCVFEGMIHLVRYIELARYCGNRVKKAETPCNMLLSYKVVEKERVRIV